MWESGDNERCVYGKMSFVRTVGIVILMEEEKMTGAEGKMKAVVAGHICVDITPVFPVTARESIHQVLEPGKLIQVGAADIHTGGAVANTGLAMKRMGIDVKLMGKIGADPFGENVLSILQSYDAQGDMITDNHVSTSYSIVLAVPGTDRIFLHNPGANDSFSSEDLDMNKISGAHLFHFGYPPLMKKMYENSGAELIRIFREIYKMGIVTSLDFAAIDPKSEAGRQDWEAILKQVLPWVDFFMPSMEELCFMLDREMYCEWQRRAAGSDIAEVIRKDEIRSLGERLVQLGAGSMLIKCGSFGFYYRMADAGRLAHVEERIGRSLKEWCGKQGFESCYQPEQILSGTGAGDTTIAAFLTALLQGYSLKNCLRLASAAGAGCVEHIDALSGVRPLDEQMDRIRRGWKKTV